MGFALLYFGAFCEENKQYKRYSRYLILGRQKKGIAMGLYIISD